MMLNIWLRWPLTLSELCKIQSRLPRRPLVFSFDSLFFRRGLAICFSFSIIPFTSPLFQSVLLVHLPFYYPPHLYIFLPLLVLLFLSLYILQAYPPVSDKKVIRLLMASISFPLLSSQSLVYCIPEDSLCCF